MNWTRIVTAALAVAFTSACVTTDPWTGQERTSRAGQGAAIGAGIGAVLGAVSGGDRLERAAIGAGLGAISGVAVGGYMDEQEAALRRQLRGTGVSVTRRGDQIILNMPGHITFDFGSSALRSDFYSVLNSVALVVNEFEHTVLVIDGHTDAVGSDAFNLELSIERAERVGQYLIAQQVAAMRMATYGYGERYPIADNASNAGRMQNRRVELTLMPVT
ncbi:MAG: OmpA family protein [Pseudomonadota bacterium]